MKYIPIFNDDSRLLAAGVVALTIISLGFIVTIFGQWIPFIKKWYSRKRMTSIMFILGFVFGFIIAWINNFEIYDYTSQKFDWIKNLIYLSSSFVRLSFTIMFLGFLLMLPFRMFSNFYMFSKYRKPVKKIAKMSSMYFFFGGVALLISCLQYLFKDSFFAFSSNFSYSTSFSPESVPTIYYICDYVLSVLLNIKSPSFSIYLFIALVILIIFEIIFIKLMNFYRPKTISRIARYVDKISKLSDLFATVTPVFAFAGIAVSLMVQTIATFLRISVVLLLVIILSVVILCLNFIYTFWTRTINYSTYKNAMIKGLKHIIVNPLTNSNIGQLIDRKIYNGFKDFGKEQDIYNIFVNAIFPLVITSYLGFSSGPLFDPNFKPLYHAFYFVFLYLFGYIYMLAYAFKYQDIVPFKVMLWSSTPYIRSGFNTSILLFFNNMINKAAAFVTFATFISIACKHEKHYRKIIF